MTTTLHTGVITPRIYQSCPVVILWSCNTVLTGILLSQSSGNHLSVPNFHLGTETTSLTLFSNIFVIVSRKRLEEGSCRNVVKINKNLSD